MADSDPLSGQHLTDHCDNVCTESEVRVPSCVDYDDSRFFKIEVQDPPPDSGSDSERERASKKDMYGKLVDNFSPKSDVTSLQDPFTSRPGKACAGYA